jgi:hypothetical protein
LKVTGVSDIAFARYTGPTVGRHWEHRDPGDDFYCLRYGVWYPSFDCAYRTKFRTCPGCAACEQGRFNLQRHRLALADVRLPMID